MFRTLFLVVCLSFALPVEAACTFKTGDYISELGNPYNVNHIDIKVPKSAKYARNLLKILTSSSLNIPPKLKKNFKASITVFYPFGSCKFNGRIRQNGDWRDHIQLVGGNPVRSLDVKLNEGNILQAVRFKLLIPETRQSENEILATQLLRKLNFISPETFAVDVSVNGLSTTLLFQENAEKELLERNLRRESAMFEGDEELLWSYKDFPLFHLESLSLSRLTNVNWFQKGSSSEKISLAAFSKLQSSYLNFASDMEHYKTLVLDPNDDRKTFDEMAFSLLVINAAHAMRPHNRKFYFNSLKNAFEPIYYDGNPNFKNPMGRYIDDLIKVQFPNGINPQFISKFESVLKSEELKNAFMVRVKNLEFDGVKYYQSAIEQALRNIAILAEKINHNEEKVKLNKKLELAVDYADRMEKLGLEQLIFVNLAKAPRGYEGTLLNGEQVNLSTSDVSNLISKNNYKGKRAVLLNMSNANLWAKTNRIQIEGFAAEIYTSEGIKATVLNESKTLHFLQTNPMDWVLITGGSISNWSINFDGKEIVEETKSSGNQRFNALGITGCITFFEINFDNISVNVLNGGCEDSVNIISSKGTLKNIQIDKAFADALDMDFSSIEINNAFVKNAGNDCFDVSKGRYHITNGTFEVCGDKGISVGEASNLHAESLKVMSSNIGISTKDFSKVTITSAKLSEIITCVEAKQKKQEFGGAFAFLKKLDCNGSFEIDKHSIVKVGNNEF